MYPFPPSDDNRPTKWEPVDIIALLCQDGFMDPGDWRPIDMCAVVLAESGGDPLITGQTVWSPGSPAHLSVDLGIFQLNSYWHTVTGPYPDMPPIDMADCFQPFIAMEQAWGILNKERKGWAYNMTHWTAYNDGSYTDYVADAYQGIVKYREIMGFGSGVFL